MSVIKYFCAHFFLFLTVLILVIVFALSFHRFLIKRDYVVSYEGNCNPTIASCFVGCEDDECTEEYYYLQMQKYAPDLYSKCGEDITDCDDANKCLPDDRECSMTYCDPESDGDVCSSYNSDNDSSEPDFVQGSEIQN